MFQKYNHFPKGVISDSILKEPEVAPTKSQLNFILWVRWLKQGDLIILFRLIIYR